MYLNAAFPFTKVAFYLQKLLSKYYGFIPRRMTEFRAQRNNIPIIDVSPLTKRNDHTTSMPTTISPHNNNTADGAKAEAGEPEENERDHFLGGVKLYLVVAGLMFLGFLMALNGSLVATVC